MANTNAETLTAFYELLNKGSVDEAMAVLDPNFVADFSRMLNPELKGVYRGPDEVRRFFESFRDAWEELEFFVDEYVELGERVLRVGGLRAQGRGSGVEVVGRGAQLWSFRDGRPILMEQFQGKAEALEHLGSQ